MGKETLTNHLELGKIKNIEILFVSGLLPPAVSGAGKRTLRNAIEISKHKSVALLSRTKNKDLSLPHFTVLPELRLPKNKFGRTLNNILNILVLPWFVFFKLFQIPKPRIIHVFSVNWFSIFVIFYNRIFWKSKLIIELTLMGSDTPDSTSRWWLYRSLTNHCIKKADHINCISPQLNDYMIKMGYNVQKLSLIPNPIDKIYTLPKSANLNFAKESMGFKPDEFIILTIAGVTKRKGYLLIKDIIKEIPDHIPFKFISVGSYDLENQKKLMAFIKEDLEISGKADKLIFMGYKNPLPLLHASDLFILASSREGFPNALIEAMACELPVICRKIDNVSEYIINNEVNGLIIDSNEPKDFVNAITRVYNDPHMRVLLARNARKEVINRFSMEKISKQYLNTYSMLLEQPYSLV